MLTLLTPYILGILIQVGSIIGQFSATPDRGASTREDAEDRKAQFAKDFDSAQLLPAVITVVAATLAISPDLGRELTILTVVVALLVYAGLQAWIRKPTAMEYAHMIRLHVSPVNAGTVLIYLVLGTVVFLVKR